MVDKLKQSVTLSSSSQQQLHQPVSSVVVLGCTGPGHQGLLPCGLGCGWAGEQSRALTELLKDNNNCNTELRAMSLEQD